MLILMTLVGLIIGWLLYWASDYFPRFSVQQPTVNIAAFGSPPPLAIWHLLKSSPARQTPWFGLHVGVEVMSAVLVAFLWAHFGLSWDLVLVSGICAFFALIAIIDIKYRLVLNLFTYPAMVLVLLVHVFVVKSNPLHILLGGGLAFGIFFLTAWLKPGDLGGGDVKLATLIGFIFGFPQILWALIVGAGIGGIVAVYLLFGQHDGMKRTIPYAPFLCFGAMVAFLYNPLILLSL